MTWYGSVCGVYFLTSSSRRGANSNQAPGQPWRRITGVGAEVGEAVQAALLIAPGVGRGRGPSVLSVDEPVARDAEGGVVGHVRVRGVVGGHADVGLAGGRGGFAPREGR